MQLRRAKLHAEQRQAAHAEPAEVGVDHVHAIFRRAIILDSCAAARSGRNHYEHMRMC
tara:strand:+ start:929 stop:1102 length:174 start_codon:yes stop_codon:yes gene_type:complete